MGPRRRPGSLSGEATVARPAQRAGGRGRASPRATAATTAWPTRTGGAARLEVARATTEVRAGPRAPGRRAGSSFRGQLTDDGVYDGEAAGDGRGAGEVLPRPSRSGPVTGGVTGSCCCRGRSRRPRLAGRLRRPACSWGTRAWGRSTRHAARAGRRQIGRRRPLPLGARGPRPRGNGGRGGALRRRAQPCAGATSLDPFLRVRLARAARAALGARGHGRAARSRDPLATAPADRGRGELADARAPAAGLPGAESRAACACASRTRQLDLRPAAPRGRGHRPRAAGGADALGDGPLALSVRATPTCARFALLSRRLRGRGAARLALTVAGTRAAPRAGGTASTLEGAGLRVRGFPHGLEECAGAVRFSEQAADLEERDGARSPGATLELGGQPAYAGGRLRSFDMRPPGRGLAPALSGRPAQPGRRGPAASSATPSGSGSRGRSTCGRRSRPGATTWPRSSWPRARSPRRAPSLEEGLRLDVKRPRPGHARDRQQPRDLQARADLALQGTSTPPWSRARGGRARARLLPGPHLRDPARQPRLREPAAARPPLRHRGGDAHPLLPRHPARHGTLERVTPRSPRTRRSPPCRSWPCSPAPTRARWPPRPPGAANAGQLAATGAATLAAGRISEEVGLERGAERLFGLNRFSIDPSLLRGAAPTPPRASPSASA